MTRNRYRLAGSVRPFILLIIIAGITIAVAATKAQSAPPPPVGDDFTFIEFTRIAGPFHLITDFEFTPDGRILATQKAGLVRVVKPDGTILQQPFLDLTGQVSVDGEEGLVSIALHPAYETNGYFYVNYTDLDEVSRTERYQVSASDPNIADPSAYTILEVAQPSSIHNGAELVFGPDGYLYIGLGDGGGADDPHNNAQDGQTLLGTILRIDVDSGAPYTIPADNPFVDDEQVLDEIWAMGLRNPWRFSFDPLNGDLYIGDVGAERFEEINFERAPASGGVNYGWRCYEGETSHILDGCQEQAAYESPIVVLAHPHVCAVVGGGVYRADPAIPIYGQYLFGDYCSGAIWGAAEDEPGKWRRILYGSLPHGYLSTFGQDQSGEVYAADLGNIYRLTVRVVPLSPQLYVPLIAVG